MFKIFYLINFERGLSLWNWQPIRGSDISCMNFLASHCELKHAKQLSNLQRQKYSPQK